ncbi:MAG: OmpH family outer membrane protein [Porphyromonadaceae bacterium]|nr:MAG: OmpH family outer membrane protein [Porphyromonadaceae bacterium]
MNNKARRSKTNFKRKAKSSKNLKRLKAAQATIEAKTKEAQDLYTRLQNFSQTAQQDLQKQQETLMAPIQQKLQNAIQAVGAKGGYTAILDSATLLYKGNSMEDVSAKVKAELGIK